MKIKPVLARLQNVLGDSEIVQKIVLQLATATLPIDGNISERSLNLVVGYDGSPDSQAALDLALLIAHQTRLATQHRVTIHVAYVLDDKYERLTNVYSPTDALRQWHKSNSNGNVAIATHPHKAIERLELADRILWQARCLAEEWKGTFVAHLRFGSLAAELRKIVESETADILLLGCRSQDSPIIQQLGTNLPCTVLGISDLTVN